MNTPTLTPSAERRDVWVTPPRVERLPAKVRASFGRLRDRFGWVQNSGWTGSLQPDHLLAYAVWSETLSDHEESAADR